MCFQYWPSKMDDTEIYGLFQVEACAEERVLPEYTVRKFKISSIKNVSIYMICLLLVYSNSSVHFHSFMHSYIHPSIHLSINPSIHY